MSAPSDDLLYEVHVIETPGAQDGLGHLQHRTQRPQVIARRRVK